MRSPVSVIAVALIAMVGAGAGCGRNEQNAPAAAAKPEAAPVAPGIISIAPGSPQLAQIRVEAVKTLDVPTDEVVAPGRVGINPSHSSRVLLPVPGRIASVMARLGDAVEENQPVLTLESPDADGAIGSYRQAEVAERQAQATLVKAEADFQRASDLYERRPRRTSLAPRTTWPRREPPWRLRAPRSPRPRAGSSCSASGRPTASHGSSFGRRSAARSSS